MDENMDIAQAQVMLQLRQMTISREQTSASLPAIASSDSVLSLASVSSMSQTDSGMGSDSDKEELMESDHEDTEISKGTEEQLKTHSSQPSADQINGFPHILKRAHLIPMDSQNLI